jgi:1-acyl-sn-glycerol-3-phosphate acyltransferase
VHDRFYWFHRNLARGLLHLFMRPVVVDPLPEDSGPCLVVCNHISHFDPPALGALYPHKIDFMAMDDLFRHPLARRFFLKVNAFPVSREQTDTTAVREAVRRLRAGRIVGIFPEGGIRTGSGSVLSGTPLPAGAASIAHMARVPAQMMLLIGTDQLYRTKNLLRRKPCYLLTGPRLVPDPALPAKQAREQLRAAMEESLRSLYTRLLQTVRPDPSALPRTAQERWAEA